MFRWGRGSEKKPVMVMAEPPKAVPATAGSAVHAVEKAKEPGPEGKVEAAAEGEGQGEDDVEELLAQHQELVDSMLAEGILDDQFLQLQMLQDESTPDFMEELVTLFFDDSVKLLENLTESLKTDPIDYKVVDGHVHQFKGSSSSIGAQHVKEVCITFRHCCDNQDKQGCLDQLVQVKKEFNIVRSKLGKMLELEKKIVALGGVLPFMEC